MNSGTPQHCALLTGATGFLGAQVARRLIKENNLGIIALVRAENPAAAIQRLSRAWWDWPELVDALRASDAVEALAGDVTLPHLGLGDAAWQNLAGRVTHIIHCAADLRADASLEDLRRTNLQGTETMLELAHLAHRSHNLKRYAHVSTAYVAGRRSGEIYEADLNANAGFANTYELSKYEGECLVEAAKRDLPVSVFRPGMVVGDSLSGEIRTFNTFYFPLRLFLTGKLPVIPADPTLPVNIIPVDYAADAIARLTFHPEAEGLNFHLTLPTDTLPSAAELVDFVRGWSRAHLGMNLPKPLFIKLPLPQKRHHLQTTDVDNSTTSAPPRKKPFGAEVNGLLTILPYFADRKQFRRDNLDRLMGSNLPCWREYLPRLLAYAVDQGFMHRTERTVHEQLLTRLQSRSRPVTYFDIVQGKPIRRSAGEIREEILAAAASLKAHGIQPGERVAIVGLNSTRYLALDAAIGLTGAVSVPLYYTSPPAEIDHILSASGARMLFIGAPKIMERLAEIKTLLPVVNFCREQGTAQAGRDTLSWQAFLDLGKGQPPPTRSPAGFDDLATLRYTSGTTGQPKGVSFQHRHLRWMGQTMAALLPWKARTRPANYLSFLPMNHVVEGILATYCPYYLPAAVNIYFLENLRDVQRTLPSLKPTIFFSVPRIYEKIWEAFASNPAGRLYINLKTGLLKNALRTLLRRQTLRKSGLGRCAQIITGSAPCSETLLENFRELGIEIHNAYGLTEAPLITINRLGANRPGTVGETLPQTEIRIAEDGEVLVRGPQVMAGYFEAQSSENVPQPFQDGWLQTGDLGSLTAKGSLILNGRKKELIKTSYGKYVQPAKVEALLREIPGVAEAMLVGEARPFCAVLLWVQDANLGAAAAQVIERMMGSINQSLSHPEQVKRWAVLANDLSIEGGDLTANLKLKRLAILRRQADVVDCLYQKKNPPPAVLHLGGKEPD